MTEHARQHLKMKYQLAAMALEHPQRFFATLGKFGSSYLLALWDGLGRELPEEARATSAGLTSTTLEVDGLRMLAVTFPSPSRRGDAYFLAVVALGQKYRVFILELAFDLDGSAHSALIEVQADGRANWGTGPAPDLGSFAGAVAALVRDPGRRPLSFARMRFS